MVKKSINNITNNNYIDFVMDRDFDIRNRIIYFWDRYDMEDSTNNLLDKSVSAGFIKSLNLLAAESNEPIVVLINSCGGSVTDGYAIYDAIRTCHCKVIGKVIGDCMSAATMVLLACDERLSFPKSTFMVHDGTPGSIGYTVRDSEAWISWGKKERHQYYNILSEATNKSAKFWEKMCRSDKVFMADKALQYGLINAILDYPTKK